MPRNAKRHHTQSGAPAQPVAPVPGQQYGAGVEQAALQRAMPAPQARGAAAVAAPAPSQSTAGSIPQQPMADAGAVAAPTQASDQDRYLAAMQAAQQLRGSTGLLSGGTTRPNEPITAGLSRGPGPGPEALGMRGGSPTGDFFRKLSAATNDPYFAQLAQRARS